VRICGPRPVLKHRTNPNHFKMKYHFKLKYATIDIASLLWPKSHYSLDLRGMVPKIRRHFGLKWARPSPLTICIPFFRSHTFPRLILRCHLLRLPLSLAWLLLRRRLRVLFDGYLTGGMLGGGGCFVGRLVFLFP